MKNATSKNLLRGALLALAACALPALAGPDNVGLGTGRDGPLTVDSNGLVINVYAQVTAPLAPGDTAIPFANATGAISAGDLVMVLQTTGIVPTPASGGAATVDLTNDPVGRWEFARVASVAGSTLNVTEPLIHSYAGSVTQLIRVPEYTSVTINGGRSLAPADWNGATRTGGVVAFLATETFANSGSVDARGKGFRGGQPVNDPSGTLGCTGLDEPAPQGAQKGEGIADGRYGASHTGRGRVANGAGGGVCDRSGGGGGGNGGVGGQGGNSELNVDGNRAVGGEGGAALTFSLLDHLMMGGGGGAGHSTDQPGGNGGGIIFIRANQLTLPGNFFANGNSSNSATGAGSGGGAGGTIYLRISGAATCGTVQAIGGTGGNTGGIAIGPGGGGGGGRVLFQKGAGTCNLTATSVIGATPGSQLDPGAPGGAPYGATAGATGSSTVLTDGFPVLPTPVVSTPADGARINSSTPTYSGTISTPLPAGTEVAIFVDGAEVGRTTADVLGNWSSTPAAPLAPGTHSFYAVAINTSQGVQSPRSNTHTFAVDVTPPAVAVTFPANGARINNPSPTYTGTVSDDSPGLIRLVITVDGALLRDELVAAGTWTLAQPTALSEGPHTITATATDAVGNTASVSHTFTVSAGLGIPEAPVVTSPSNNAVTGNTTPAISGTAPPNSTVTVFINGTPLGTTTSDAAGNWTLTPSSPLADGPYLISATTTNAEGTSSPPSNTVRLIIDTGAPDTLIVSGPSGITDSTSAVFDFSSNEGGVTYECSLDGAAFTDCADPASFLGLSPGEHTLQVRARDSAGNVDETPAQATWTVRSPFPVDRDFLGGGLGCATSRGEPSSLGMMGLGLLAVLLARRRRL